MGTSAVECTFITHDPKSGYMRRKGLILMTHIVALDLPASSAASAAARLCTKEKEHTMGRCWDMMTI